MRRAADEVEPGPGDEDGEAERERLQLCDEARRDAREVARHRSGHAGKHGDVAEPDKAREHRKGERAEPVQRSGRAAAQAEDAESGEERERRKERYQVLVLRWSPGDA